ncbi:MAG TPA: queuosine precursor transporter [Noviherbaspirillum sp.]|nr:queuosine precursor transporter [Noviherbaspirillum sp.]
MTPSTPPYRYYDYIVAASVTTLLCANLIGPAKVIDVALPGLGIVTMSAGVLFLPLFYTFGKIVSEVYGHAHNCRVIWAGFVALVLTAVLSLFVVGLAPAADPFSSEYQKHLEAVFGNTPRVVLASMIAFLCGSFVNNHVMTALKTVMRGRHLFLRTFGATVCSQFVDSCLFYLIAFYGLWAQEQLLTVIAAQYVLKVGCEFVMSPATYGIIRLLKKKEEEAAHEYRAHATTFALQGMPWQAAKSG